MLFSKAISAAIVQLQEKIRREAGKTHKDRVHEFNAKLEALSEHHDIPKVRSVLQYAAAFLNAKSGRPWVTSRIRPVFLRVSTMLCYLSATAFHELYPPISLCHIRSNTINTKSVRRKMLIVG